MSTDDLAVLPNISIYTKEIKAYIHSLICAHMFFRVLLISPRNPEYIEWPSASEWVNKL